MSKLNTEIERDAEQLLVSGVRDLGGVAYKFTSPGNAGVPDRIVIIAGVVIFIELKSRSGRLRPSQVMQHKRIQAAGGEVITLHGVDEVRNWLRRMEGKP